MAGIVWKYGRFVPDGCVEIPRYYSGQLINNNHDVGYIPQEWLAFADDPIWVDTTFDDEMFDPDSVVLCSSEITMPFKNGIYLLLINGIAEFRYVQSVHGGWLISSYKTLGTQFLPRIEVMGAAVQAFDNEEELKKYYN